MFLQRIFSRDKLRCSDYFMTASRRSPVMHSRGHPMSVLQAARPELRKTVSLITKFGPPEVDPVETLRMRTRAKCIQECTYHAF